MINIEILDKDVVELEVPGKVALIKRAEWGHIAGDISNQEDLQAELDLKAKEIDLENHMNNKENPHQVTKIQVGLGNVDNTSDADKPISTATQTALELKANVSRVEVVENDINSLSSNINTLNNSVTELQNSVGGLENDINSLYDKKEDITNKVTTLSAQSTDIQYPSAKVVYDNTITPINNINSKIPVQATSENQLADKNFVNSSIATNTANFKGTYDIVNDLGLTASATHEQVAIALSTIIIGATNNDYCFVLIPSTTQVGVVDEYDRYKYNGTSWVFEYSLNNSSFTSDQWAAINSGITPALVEQIIINENNITLKENTSNKVTSISSSSTDTEYPSAKAVYTALSKKVGNNPGVSHANRILTIGGDGSTAGKGKARWSKIEAGQGIDLDIVQDTSSTPSSYTFKLNDNIINELNAKANVVDVYNKTEVDNKLIEKANDNEVVHKTGNEDIYGTKIFNTQTSFIGETNRCDAILVGNGAVTIGIGATGISLDGDTETHGFIAFPDTTEIPAGEYKTFATTDDMPTQTSQLENNSGFITNAVDNLTNYRTSAMQDIIDSGKATTAQINNLQSQIDLKENTSNKVTSITASSTDVQYPSAKAVYDELNNKVDKVSGKGLSTNDFTNADKSKLDGVESGAEVNVIEDIKVDNVSLIPTNKSVNIDLSGKANADDVYTKDEADALLNKKASASELASHIQDDSNPHNVTKVQVGLGNVDNTSDLDKPISNATQNALEEKVSDIKVNGQSVVTDNVGNITVPTTTNELTNNSGFITKSVDDLTNYRTSVNQDIIDSGKATTTQINNLQSQIDLKENTSNKVTSITASSTDIQYPSAKAVYDELNNKVDKVSGKGLSTNDFTNADKSKLDGIESGAEVNVIEDIKVDNVSLTPTNKSVNIDLSGKENISNKVTSLNASSTDVQYPSAKCVYDNIPTNVSQLNNDSGYLTLGTLPIYNGGVQ